MSADSRLSRARFAKKDDGLVLRAMSKTRVGSVGEVLSGLMGASLLATIYT